MDPSEITPLILTCNEEDNIERTLGGLTWAKQILVVDSFSTDSTIARAEAAHPHVAVVQRPFDTHATQWNFGLEQIATPWVLALDADYQVPAEFEAEIVKIDPAKEVVGYETEFCYCVFGRPLRATLYPPHVVLFRKGQGRYVDEGHTQVLRLTGKIQRLDSRIAHDDRKPLARWLQSQDRYMVIESKHLLATPGGRLKIADRLRKRIFFAPPAMFLYLLFGRGLILDGWPGWFYVFQRTLAETLLSLRLLIACYGRQGWQGDGTKPCDPGGVEI
jgi:glycosyltransferase involved in cell wall biosynthesis